MPKPVSHLHEDLLLQALVIDDCCVRRYEGNTVTVAIWQVDGVSGHIRGCSIQPIQGLW